MIDKKDIINAWDTYKNEYDFVQLRNGELRQFWAHMFHIFETETLYASVRHLKPKNIIEFSPASGWKSSVMLKASLKNKEEDPTYKATIKSFDLVSNSASADYDDGSISRKLLIGDALKNVPPHMDNCYFLFIDSDHSGEFTKQYLSLIVSIYKKGLIWVHDWEGYEWGDPNAKLPAHIQEAVNSGGFSPTSDEPREFKKYLKTIDGIKINPVINLMDYLFFEMSGKLREGILARAAGSRFERSPSQLLYKKESLI